MTAIDAIVDALLRARRSAHRMDGSLLPSPDYDQALEIQRRVQETLGPVGGFKVARRPEGPPVIAPISMDSIVPIGSDIAVADRLGIELEIGFEAITDHTPGMIGRPQDHFRPLIVIELVNNRLVGTEDDALLKLADMQINSGLVVGPSLETWDGRDFSNVRGRLRCGTETVIDGDVAVPGCSALGNLVHFLEHVGDHCGGLRKGQIVITGSLCGLPFFPSGTSVCGEIAGFGEVTCQLV